MDEYIKKRDAVECIRNVMRTLGHNYTQATEIDQIMELEAEDAVPVVHGHWEQSGFCEVRDKWTTYKCSVCGTSNGRKFNDKYCRNCGSKMDEDGEQDDN